MTADLLLQAAVSGVLLGGVYGLVASGLSLIANTAPVAYGALGTPIAGLASVTGLDPFLLGAMVGRQLPFFSLIVPFWVVWAFAGWKGMKDVWPAILVTGVSFAIPFVACGGTGVISVVSNLVPGDTARLVKESAAGNWAVARPLNTRIVELSKSLFATTSPIPVKAGMAMLGLCSADLRLPLVSDDKAAAGVQAAMKRYGGLLG